MCWNLSTDNMHSKSRVAHQKTVLGNHSETPTWPVEDSIVKQGSCLEPTQLETRLIKWRISFSIRKKRRQKMCLRWDERFAWNCVEEVDNVGGSSVMMWKIISWRKQPVHFLGNLNPVRFRDEIIHLLPAIDVNRAVLQHDNARLTINYLEQIKCKFNALAIRIIGSHSYWASVGWIG